MKNVRNLQRLTLLCVCLMGCATRDPHASKSYVDLGVFYLEQGQYPRAKAKLTRALVLNPNSPEAHSAMGLYYEKTHRKALAQESYLNALTLGKHAGEYLNNYAAFLCREGDFAHANLFFEKAMNDPNYRDQEKVYLNAGLCASKQGKEDLAKQYTEKAFWLSGETAHE